VFGVIKRELRHRSAIEPVIGHLKGRGSRRRRRNATLSAGGYNIRRILAWLRSLLRLFLIAFARHLISQSTLDPAY
jgi:IS5 family transposase